MDRKLYEHLLTRVRKRNMSLRDGEGADLSNEPEIPPPTAADLAEMASAELKHTIATGISRIDAYKVTPEADPTTITVLDGYRVELINLKDLPGSQDVINGECARIIDAISDILDYQFRFEII